jgi:hypothetical protein
MLSRFGCVVVSGLLLLQAEAVADESWATSLPPPVKRLGEQPPTEGYRIRRPGYFMTVQPDGSVKFKDVEVEARFEGLSLVVTFDLTDIVMRRLKQDPYAYDKLQMLDSTRTHRWDMRRKYDTAVMDLAVRHLPRDLERIWNDPLRSVDEKKRILFARWDEVEDGHVARILIEDFIATQLGAGSGVEFSAEELTEYNLARTTHASFDPYRPRLGPPVPHHLMQAQRAGANGDAAY